MIILEECDLCHDTFPLHDLMFNGKQYLCNKCKASMKTQRPLEACPICYTKHTVPEMFRDEVTGNYHYPVTDCHECGAKLTVVVPNVKTETGFMFKLITIGLKRLEYN